MPFIATCDLKTGAQTTFSTTSLALTITASPDRVFWTADDGSIRSCPHGATCAADVTEVSSGEVGDVTELTYTAAAS